MNSHISSLARTAPFAVYILFLALADPLSTWFSHMGLDVRWLYAMRIGAVGALLLLFAGNYQELKGRAARLNGHSWAISVVTGIAVFAIWIMPLPQWAQMGSSTGFNPLGSDGNIDFMQAVVRLTGAAIVVPVMEELFWRSFLLRWIRNHDFLNVDPSTVGWMAFAIVAVLFGFEHSLWLAGIVAGAAYNWLYMARRTLWAPIVAHAVTNGLLGLWVLQTGNWQYW